MFGALAFTLLILSGYYPPEIRSINLDVDFFYRKAGVWANRILDQGLNSINAASERFVLRLARFTAVLFNNLAGGLLMFCFVNVWLLLGYRDKRLELKKTKLHNELREGTLPIGIGAAVAISFILLVFILT